MHGVTVLDRPFGRAQAITIVQWAIALVILGAAIGLGVARFGMHVSTTAVLTGSMRPTFGPGDAVITRPIAAGDVRPGMVILATPRGEPAAYAHRVTAVQHNGGAIVVRTRGDANPAADDWQDLFAPTSTVPQVVGSVPKLGYLIEAAHGRTAQRNVGPVAVAGLLVTLLASALVLVAGTPPRRIGTR